MLSTLDHRLELTLARVHDRWISPAWSPAFRGYFADRRPMLWDGIVVAILTPLVTLFDRHGLVTAAWCALAALGAGVSCGYEVLYADQRFSRWALLFQRPALPSDHFRRVLAIAAGTLLLWLMALLVPTTIIQFIRGSVAISHVGVACAGYALLAINLFVVTVGMSVLPTPEDRLFSAGLLCAASLVIEWADSIPTWFSSAVDPLLFPIDGLWAFSPLMLDLEWPTRWQLLHPIVYPLLWLVVVEGAVRVLDRRMIREPRDSASLA